jgi:hypothetical protein
MSNAQYGLSEEDVRNLKEIKAWWQRNKGIFGQPTRRNPRLFGGGGSDIRRAITTAAAGTGTSITANFFNSAGIEITTGVEGTDYNIPVYCNLNGETDLNAVSPRLTNDTVIFVISCQFDNAGTPEARWYAVDIFQASLDYEWI